MDRPTWRALGASVRGTSHEKTGQPCQDAHCLELLPDGSLVAAVADGAGSAALGEVGAGVVADAEGTLIAITTPAAGEYVNETIFLVSPGAWRRRKGTSRADGRRMWRSFAMGFRCWP